MFHIICNWHSGTPPYFGHVLINKTITGQSEQVLGCRFNWLLVRKYQFREDNIPRNKYVAWPSITNSPTFPAMRIAQKNALSTPLTKFILGAINPVCKTETSKHAQGLVLRWVPVQQLIRNLEITGSQHTLTPKQNRQMCLKSQCEPHLEYVYACAPYARSAEKSQHMKFNV